MSETLSELERARLRWRARRGLLENDLMISRFLDACEQQLTAADVLALTKLFELPDHDLLDVLLGRTELAPELNDPITRGLVEQIKAL